MRILILSATADLKSIAPLQTTSIVAAGLAVSALTLAALEVGPLVVLAVQQAGVQQAGVQQAGVRQAEAQLEEAARVVVLRMDLVVVVEQELLADLERVHACQAFALAWEVMSISITLIAMEKLLRRVLLGVAILATEQIPPLTAKHRALVQRRQVAVPVQNEATFGFVKI
jgi:hypothetical protein